jgi:hypothetical protein
MAAIALACMFIPCLAGQDTDYHRNNVVFGVGAAIPNGTSSSYLSTAPLIDLAYGYRFNRFLQADAGLLIGFGAASNNQNAEISDAGLVQGTDHEYMLPLGGRIYIPQPFSRIEVSAGGGTAYLHYSESVSSGGSYYSINCYSCTSRSGWGGYGMGNVSYFLDSNRNFHVGATAQFIAASTNGPAVGSVPGNKTTDHWVNLLAEFGFSF